MMLTIKVHQIFLSMLLLMMIVKGVFKMHVHTGAENEMRFKVYSKCVLMLMLTMKMQGFFIMHVHDISIKC